MKRQRVSIACQKCRVLKTKCDGQQPLCGRCVGYGFECTWPQRRNSDAKQKATVQTMVDRFPEHLNLSSMIMASDSTDAMHRVSDLYEGLICSIRSKLEGPERAALDVTLDSIRKQLSAKPTICLPKESSEDSPNDASAKSLTYHGKASDIRFFNSIREFMREDETSNGMEENVALSYDQSSLSEFPSVAGMPLDFPSREVALKYLDIYFSTIHIAYPFLDKPMVMRHFERIWKGDFKATNDRPWLALLNFIFAIGAYYTSFPCTEGEASSTHPQYFKQALFFSNQLFATCTLTYIWILLTRCFFLLAISQTDRCWNTLGLAIRISQSIGLHVDISYSKHERRLTLLEYELRRRAWYSMYVLDRLLALQLGRPVAIHEADYNVKLPSQYESPECEDEHESSHKTHQGKDIIHPEERIGNPNGQNNDKCNEHASAIDYFLSVIKFSHILGQVIRELYQPTQVEYSPDEMLFSTSSLDTALSKWKVGLPRHLRFDIGHTFEKSITFKRQRNMLAIKFHHLRAVVHRPFLCLPWLQRNNPLFMNLLRRDRGRIDRAEMICISEAQQTAHLLHNIVDERCLVHDFPWWQMISCLLCASSILLVASAFFRENTEPTSLLVEGLKQDAETCLKVFEALSINSEAARKATDMLKGLSNLETWYRRQNEPRNLAFQVLSSDEAQTIDFDSSSALLPPGDPPAANGPDSNYYDLFNQWPSEMSDTMDWSAQFLFQN